MALLPPFLSGLSRKSRSQVIAVDLGHRTTKAILLEKRGDLWVLKRYALVDAPIFEKKMSPEMLADHLHSVAQSLGGSTKYMAIAVGLDDAVVRQIEMPQIPVEEMRSILKINYKNYLQQDLPNYVFDCYVIPPRSGAQPKRPEPGQAENAHLKLKVLTTGAKEQYINDFLQATNTAGLTADALVPSLVGPLNAFERAEPEVFAKETVALVEIGFKHTFVCILDRGELATNRVINIGGDQITTGLAEMKNISYAEAEGIKVGMAAEVESELQMQVLPLGREIRASLDFFEHQHDRPVSQVYFSGGTSNSEIIREMLHSEILVECKTWVPTGFLQMALPGQQAMEIEHVGPQLTVAIGTALAVY